MNKLSILFGFVCLYVSLVMFISDKTGQNFTNSNLSIPKIIAGAWFDSDDSNTWYNPDNSSAEVYYDNNPPPSVPVQVITITRHSH